MAEVSVIIPIYNVEKYLSFCLDSVINQTFKDIEIICINDGSTDNSRLILDHYAKFDNRIKIIDKENGGLSSARNVGIMESSGKYLVCLDSDDFVSDFLVEKSISAIKKNNADVLCYNYYAVVGNKLQLQTPALQFPDYMDEKCLTEKDLKDDAYTFIHPTAWCKFYSADFIKSNNLKYPEDIIFEDLPFFAEAYLKAEKLYFTNLPLYYYRTFREGSILAEKGRKTFDFIKSISMVDEIFMKYGKFGKYKNTLLQYKMQLAVYYLSIIKQEYREEFFNMLKNYFSKIDYRDYKKSILENNIYYKKIALMLSCNYSAFVKAEKNYV